MNGFARYACAAAAWLLCIGSAAAATVAVEVVGAASAPAPETVVYAEPVGRQTPAARPKPAAIDQINKEFVPRVSAVQVGTPVTFPNKDNIRHQIYSFSPAKTFQIKLYHGTPSQPVVFDQAGTVILGCNIHDRMIAYVLVVDTPYFAKTDARGHARLEGLPPGEYELRAWQPEAKSGQPQASGAALGARQRVTIAADGAAPPVKLELRPGV
jgi:plastocyanin